MESPLRTQGTPPCHLRISGVDRCCCLCLLVPALAAEEAAPAAKPGPQAEEFYRLHSQMNALLGELADLQVKYRTADDEQRAEIQQQWKELIAKGEKLEPKLIAAAEKAYAEAPNADKQITDFLVRLLRRWCSATITSRPPRSASC